MKASEIIWYSVSGFLKGFFGIILLTILVLLLASSAVGQTQTERWVPYRVGDTVIRQEGPPSQTITINDGPVLRACLDHRERLMDRITILEAQIESLQ